MKMMFDETDYRELKDGETYENKFVILDPSQFKPEYRNAQCQLFFAVSGFGCYPDKLGGKVFGQLFDEHYQTRREYILGVATEEAIKQWESLYGSRNMFYVDTYVEHKDYGKGVIKKVSDGKLYIEFKVGQRIFYDDAFDKEHLRHI